VATAGTLGVTLLEAGGNLTCMTLDRAAYCWRDNAYGSLGNDSNVSSALPVPVHGLTTHVTQISAGAAHACAIANQSAYCWGLNFWGGLGDGTMTDSRVPVPVVGLDSNVEAISAGGGGQTCAVAHGHVLCWGAGNNPPTAQDGIPQRVPTL
jgi:serine/threonine-protein kinase